jgi:hypothetical protein
MLYGGSKMRKPVITNSLIGCLIFMCLFAACKDKEAPKIYNHSSALIILNNAEKPFYDIRDGGSIQLSYKIKEEYPATSVIKQLSAQLEANGWKLLKEDYLNPGLPSSHVKGWSDFEDATRPPTKIVHSWMGDWEDKYGNIVRYVFIYEYPKNKDKNLSVLQIHEIYTPASLVTLIKEELKKQGLIKP